MIAASLRDLQWRRRRFLIAVIGTALVFAMSLLAAGLSQAFRAEADRWLRSTGADQFVTKAGTAGPFTVISPFEAARADEVETLPGVTKADAMVFARATVEPGRKDVNVFGIVNSGLGTPNLVAGRAPVARGEAIVNDSLGLALGQEFTLNGTPFRVAGLTEKSTLVIGAENIYVSLVDAQRLFLGGLPLATAILVRGVAESLPDGLISFDRPAARDDLLRPLGDALDSINVVRVMLWIVAACIVGSVVYLSAIERTRDFAVFKAVGVSTPSLGVGLALQAVLLALASALVAAVLARLLAPSFPLPVELPRSALLRLPVIAIVVGLAASLVGLRRAVKVPPAAAFGGP